LSIYLFIYLDLFIYFKVNDHRGQGNNGVHSGLVYISFFFFVFFFLSYCFLSRGVKSMKALFVNSEIRRIGMEQIQRTMVEAETVQLAL